MWIMNSINLRKLMFWAGTRVEFRWSLRDQRWELWWDWDQFQLVNFLTTGSCPQQSELSR